MPGEDTPRKTTTYRDFDGMNSQNERYKVKPTEFPWLENIMRSGPRLLKSIPGPRLLTSVPIAPVGCPPSTAPTGTQTIALTKCYNFNTGIPPGTLPGNSAGQMDFVTDTNGVPEFIATVSIQSGFGGNYDLNLWNPGFGFQPISPFFQIIHAVGDSMSVETPVPIGDPDGHFTFFPQTAQSGQPGKSDELSYYFVGIRHHLAGAFNAGAYFSVPDQTVAYFSHGDTGQIPIGPWSKHGDFFYVANNHGVFKYRVSTGILNPTNAAFNPPLWGPLPPTTINGGMQASANFLWLLAINNSTGSTVYKCDTDGNVLRTYPLGLTHFGFGGLLSFSVVDDNLIYLWGANTVNLFDLYYMRTSDGIVHALNETTPNFTIPPNDPCGGYGVPSVFGLQYNNIIFHKGCLFSINGLNNGGGGYVARICGLVCPGQTVPIGA